MGPDLPVQLIVHEAYPTVAPEVPVHARGPDVGARQPVGQAHVGRDHADTASPGLEDLVAGNEVLHLVAELVDATQHALRLVDPALREVVLQAANAIEVGVESATGNRLDLVEDELPVAEGKEDWRDGTQLHAHIAEEQDHVGDPGQFKQDRTDPLSPRWGLDVHEPLGSQDKRHLVGEATQPVDAVDQSGDLGVRPDLGEFLVAPVHVAHHRLSGHHPLAIKFHDNSQRPVGGRVLRTDVQGHAFGLYLDVDPGIAGLAGDVGHLARVAHGGHDASSPSSTASSSSPPGMSSTSTMPGQGFTRRANSG